ncbi:major facilitator superfamily domain-containing protein [Leptodontidium sp. 2 PMI_412]|nr:major facilitator superfamily domain-containing protein [Leptodontidium sp. 2 PMI_412]
MKLLKVENQSAAAIRATIHHRWLLERTRGIAILAPTLHILSALGIAAHPPFFLVLLAFDAISLGTGLLDGSWCAWAASMHNANTVTGMLQGYLAIWLSALHFLSYVGIETAISGWIDLFMIRHRKSTPYSASMASTGFWGGMAVGRFALGVLADKLGVGRANIIYFLIAIALQTVFAFLEGRTTSIFLMTFVGFFMGPMFASGVVLMTRLLPAELHVAAVSFVASAGQVGAALLPFGIGALIQGIGIGVFRFAVINRSTILALMAWIPVSRLQQTTSQQCSPSREGHDREE